MRLCSLWVIIDLAYVAKQYATIGTVTDSMWLVVLFHAWYVFDCEINEVRPLPFLDLCVDAHARPRKSAILSTMDITTDGLGFMLSVGDFVWVPMTYSLQARYLAYFPTHLGFFGVAGVLGVQLVGYYIFRSANGEKNDFRNGKNPKSARPASCEPAGVLTAGEQT